MINWSKVLGGGGVNVNNLLQKHAEGIAKTFADAKKGHGVSINLNLMLKPGQDEAVSTKATISYAPERVKDYIEATFTDNGEMVEPPLPMDDEPEGDDPAE